MEKAQLVAPETLKSSSLELAPEAVLVTTILMPANVVPAAFQVSVKL
jgi:hypothetical protein